MLASDNELQNPTNFDNAAPEVEEDATAVEVSLTQMSGLSFRRLAYLSIVVAAFASTIAVVSKVQHHKKISAAQMVADDECGGLSPLVVSKPLMATPLDEVVPDTVPAPAPGSSIPDFYLSAQPPDSCNANQSACQPDGERCFENNKSECNGNGQNTAVCCNCNGKNCGANIWYCTDDCGGLDISLPPSISSAPSTSLNPSVSTAPSTSLSPSISSAPSVSSAPSTSLSPSISSAPSVSSAPSTSSSPSISSAPSVSSAPSTSLSPSISSAPSVSSAPSTSLSPSISSAPSVSSAPSKTLNPSVSTAPSTSLNPSVSTAPSTSLNPSVSTAPSTSLNPSVSTAPSTRPTVAPTPGSSAPSVVPSSRPGSKSSKSNSAKSGKCSSSKGSKSAPARFLR